MQATKQEPVTCPPTSADIERALSQSAWPRIRFVHVRVDSGVVTLSGCVGSYHEKQVASRSVLNMPGVRGLEDQIEVFCR